MAPRSGWSASGSGVGVTVGVGVAVAAPVAELTADAARLVALPIALFALLPHPATRHPATSMADRKGKALNREPHAGSFRLVNWATAPSMMAVRAASGLIRHGGLAGAHHHGSGG